MKTQRQNKLLRKKERGITLIALVVTIIVLLILAGISIQMITGQSGILNQAQEANARTAHAEVYEALNFKAGEHLMGKSTEESTKEYPNGYPESVIEYFKDKGYIYTKEGIEGYIVNIEKLLGGKKKYGNGTDGKTDVYKLEEVIEEGAIGKVATTNPIKIATTGAEKIYKLTYYGKTSTDKVELGNIKDTQTRKIITFTFKYTGAKGKSEKIDGTHNAKEGMTFREWCKSENIEILRDGEFIALEGGFELRVGSLDDKIIDGKVYEYGEVAECISGDSEVTISTDGKTVLARDVKDGQDILFYNFETNSIEVGTVKIAFGYASASNFIKYEFEDGTILKVTDYHPIYTKEGWKSYTQRNGYPIPEIGDEVKTIEGWKKLINIEELSTSEDCYNFLVKNKNGESIRNFFTNNVLVEAVTKID